MQILWWLAAPLAVTTAAMVWALWAGRPRRPLRGEESTDAYRSFTRALGGPQSGRARTVVHQVPDRIVSVALRRPPGDGEGGAAPAPRDGQARIR